MDGALNDKDVQLFLNTLCKIPKYKMIDTITAEQFKIIADFIKPFMKSEALAFDQFAELMRWICLDQKESEINWNLLQPFGIVNPKIKI